VTGDAAAAENVTHGVNDIRLLLRETDRKNHRQNNSKNQFRDRFDILAE